MLIVRRLDVTMISGVKVRHFVVLLTSFNKVLLMLWFWTADSVIPMWSPISQ